MSNNTFYNKLNKLRTKIKERRKQELYEMINDENNKLEDKIALIKMSFKELEEKDIVNSFRDLIKGEKKDETK
jgi:DNA polymerase II small subunit/DNA polymerase delta subunit B